MYKYLPISENLQEMMVMLKSLPAHTLVFDAKSNLVDLNQPALKLLKIDNLDELKKGNTVRHAKTVLRYPDNTQVIVELCGCMVNGCRDLFLFQLFEITLSTNADLGSFISYNDNVSNPEAVIPQSVIWATNPQNAHISAQKRKPGERRSNRLAESCTIQLKSSKYRKLTKIEATIAKFAAINMSVSEIATITGKSNLSVRVIMRRVQEKQKLNAQQAAGLMINDQ